MGHLDLVTMETVPLNLMEYILQKVTLNTKRDSGSAYRILINMNSSQNEKTKRYVLNETRQNPKKIIKWNRDKQSTRYIFKNNENKDAQ